MKKTIITTGLVLIIVACFGISAAALWRIYNPTRGSSADACPTCAVVPLQGDQFEAFFPLKTKEGYTLVGTSGVANILATSSTKIIYINSYGKEASNSWYSTPDDNKVTFHYRDGHQAYYGKKMNDKKAIYVYSLYVGKLEPAEYKAYDAFTRLNASSSSSSYDFFSSEYKNRPYLVNILKDQSISNLKDWDSLGYTVIGFPEYNIGVTLYFYETASAENDPHPMTRDDMESVAWQVIDNVITHTKAK
jgi:hypothetical protein